jgi:protease YdgD
LAVLSLAATGWLLASVSPEPADARPGAQVQPGEIARSAATPVAVFGSDDRSNLPRRYEALAERMGLLFNNQARTVCTAFCVAEDLIATAAHCLARGQGAPAVRYIDFTFARNYDRRQDFSRIEGAATGSAAQNTVSGDFKLRVRPPIDAANDWAIVKLQRKACTAGGLPVRTLPIGELIEQSRANNLFQVSYHRDWAQWRPAYSKPCLAARDFEQAKWPAIAVDFLNPEAMVLHTCDTGGASSGSPLLVETGDGPAVVAINVGTYVQSRLQTENGQVTTRQRSETIANTAVNAQAFAPAIEAMRRAVILASGAPMRELQERLAARGLYKLKVDGAYGAALKSAIEVYEQENRLPVIGLATQALLMRLQQAEAAREPPRGEVTPSLATQPAR